MIYNSAFLYPTTQMSIYPGAVTGIYRGGESNPEKLSTVSVFFHLQVGMMTRARSAMSMVLSHVVPGQGTPTEKPLEASKKRGKKPARGGRRARRSRN